MTAEPHDTCWTVLRAASTGDADARSTFARRYEPTIRFFLATRWRGRVLAAEVADATQEVFVECLKPRRCARKHGSRPWTMKSGRPDALATF